jgi:hypothetical protein
MGHLAFEKHSRRLQRPYDNYWLKPRIPVIKIQDPTNVFGPNAGHRGSDRAGASVSGFKSIVYET